MTSYEDQMEQAADGEYTAALRVLGDASTPAPDAPTFRVRVEGCDRPTWDVFRRRVPISAEYSYVRYADAAAHFWGWVQRQPDDGWDTFAGIVRPAEANPYDLDRRGRDYTRGDQPWHVSLTVVNS